MFSGARTTLLGVGTGTSVRCDAEAEASELLADDMVAVAAGMGMIGGGLVLGRVESSSRKITGTGLIGQNPRR